MKLAKKKKKNHTHTHYKHPKFMILKLNIKSAPVLFWRVGVEALAMVSDQ